MSMIGVGTAVFTTAWYTSDEVRWARAWEHRWQGPNASQGCQPFFQDSQTLRCTVPSAQASPCLTLLEGLIRATFLPRPFKWGGLGGQMR